MWAPLKSIASQIAVKLDLHPKLVKPLSFCAISFGLILVWYGYKKSLSIYYKSPPEHYGLPLFGSLITMLIYKDNFKLSILPKYGKLVKYNIGTLSYYNIIDISLAHKILDIAKDRPSIANKLYEIANVTPNFASINENKNWQYRRKLMMNIFVKQLNMKQLDYNICKILKTITYEYLDLKLLKSKQNNGSNYYIGYPRECIRNSTFNTLYLSMFVIKPRIIIINDTRIIIIIII